MFLLQIVLRHHLYGGRYAVRLVPKGQFPLDQNPYQTNVAERQCRCLLVR